MKSYFRFWERNKAYTAVQFIGLAVSLGFVRSPARRYSG